MSYTTLGAIACFGGINVGLSGGVRGVLGPCEAAELAEDLCVHVAILEEIPD